MITLNDLPIDYNYNVIMDTCTANNLPIPPVNEYGALQTTLTHEELTELIVTHQQQQLFPVREAKLDTTMGMLTEQLKRSILGNTLPEYKYQEYLMVEQAVVANDLEFFEPEAILLGTTAEEELELAARATTAYKTIYNAGVINLRSLRRYITTKLPVITDEEFESIQDHLNTTPAVDITKLSIDKLID